MESCSNEANDAPRYVGRIHDFPARATRSGLVHNAGRGGAMLAYGAFEVCDPSFAPTPATPNPQSTREALRAPDASGNGCRNRQYALSQGLQGGSLPERQEYHYR
jgi:hypothetical protein